MRTLLQNYVNVRWIEPVLYVANGFPRLGTLPLQNGETLGVWIYPSGADHYFVLNVSGGTNTSLRVGVDHVDFAPLWEERTFGSRLT